MTTATTKKGWADRLADAMEVMAPIFDQPHLAAVRDGFVAMMPLLIIGALTLLVLQFPCSLARRVELLPWRHHESGPGRQAVDTRSMPRTGCCRSS